MPTILGDCQPDDPSVTQEIFGPIISLLKAKSTEDMVKLANRSEYTLAASIWTKSVSRAHTMASQVNAGIVWVNAHHLNDPSSPWGGWGPSGMGKENGRVAFRDYIREKSVIVNLEEQSKGWFEDQNVNPRYG
jgi:acyl-CoA reductase-like NAD-dependent aldehyde dehydrogenase